MSINSLQQTAAALSVSGHSSLTGAAGVHAVKTFEDQIQSFVDYGLNLLGLRRSEIVFGTAGDNAILFFDDAATMHQFSEAVQRATADHNRRKSVESAKRWFRMGAATGTVLILESERRIVGTTVARAVRLEAAAEKGELLVDSTTFDALPENLRKCYGPEEVIAGKRDERYTARRCVFLTGIGAPDADEREKVKALNEAASDVQKEILGFLATFENLLNTVQGIQLIKMVPRPIVPIKNLFAERFTEQFVNDAKLSRVPDFTGLNARKTSLKDTIRFLLQWAWDKGYFMAKFYRHKRIPSPQNDVDGKAVLDSIVDEHEGLENLSILIDVFLQRAISMSTEQHALINTFQMLPFGDQLVRVMSPHLDKWGDTVRP